MFQVHSNYRGMLQRLKHVEWVPEICTKAVPTLHLVPWTPRTAVTVMHASCQCNELYGLSMRVFSPQLTPTRTGLKLLRRVSRRLARRMPHLVPMSCDAYVSSVASTKRKLYLSARKSLLHRRLTRKDARIRMHIKADKCTNADVKSQIGGKPLKPRCIQARSKRYNVEFGRFVKPLEHYVYEKIKVLNTRVFAKGLNLAERARLLASKRLECTGYKIFSLDASSFDASICQAHLKHLHHLYHHVYRDAWLDHILTWRLVNVCSTAHGVSYTIKGQRMSGDCDTAFGNCWNMWIFFNAMVEDNSDRVESWDLMCDGDDCILFIKGTITASDIKASFTSFGIKVDPELCGPCIEDIEFCRSRVVALKDGIRWIRRPWRFLATFLCSEKYFTTRMSRKTRGRYISAIVTAELSLFAGCPIIDVLLRRCLATASRFTPKFTVEIARKYDSNRNTDVSISGEARVSFERAFGVTIPEQLALEAYFNDSSLDEYFAHLEVAPEHMREVALTMPGGVDVMWLRAPYHMY